MESRRSRHELLEPVSSVGRCPTVRNKPRESLGQIFHVWAALIRERWCWATGPVVGCCRYRLPHQCVILPIVSSRTAYFSCRGACIDVATFFLFTPPSAGSSLSVQSRLLTSSVSGKRNSCFGVLQKRALGDDQLVRASLAVLPRPVQVN